MKRGRSRHQIKQELIDWIRERGAEHEFDRSSAQNLLGCDIAPDYSPFAVAFRELQDLGVIHGVESPGMKRFYRFKANPRKLALAERLRLVVYHEVVLDPVVIPGFARDTRPVVLESSKK